mgnify:CR=1 FL=1
MSGAPQFLQKIAWQTNPFKDTLGPNRMGCECRKVWKLGQEIAERFLDEGVWIEEMRRRGLKGKTGGPTVEMRDVRKREGGMFEGEVMCDF